MKVDFTVKNYEAADKLKTVIQKKLDRLDKFFEHEPVKAKVLLKQNRERHTIEITVYAKNVIRSEVTGINMYDIIDVIMPKIERQIVKYRARPQDKKKRARLDDHQAARAAEGEGAIVRTKRFMLEPISLDDAIEQLELLEHAFYVYLDKDTQNVSVVYKRADAHYGVIETTVQK